MKGLAGVCCWKLLIPNILTCQNLSTRDIYHYHITYHIARYIDHGERVSNQARNDIYNINMGKISMKQRAQGKLF